MFQRLPITLAQVKAVNTSETLINEVRKIMDAIFMNSKNSKTPDPHRLLFNLSGKIDLKESDKYVDLAFTTHRKV